jgi:preprotein translocase subunit SecG
MLESILLGVQYGLMGAATLASFIVGFAVTLTVIVLIAVIVLAILSWGDRKHE